MPKMTIPEAAKLLGTTKEALYNRIRRGTMQCVEEQGVKYVTVDAPAQSSKSLAKPNAEESLIAHLHAHIAELHTRNDKLEAQLLQLVSEKEQQLLAAKEQIASIYQERDRQLRQIIELLRTKEPPTQAALPLEATWSSKASRGKWRSLKKIAKERGYSRQHRKYVKKSLLNRLAGDVRLKKIHKKLFIQTAAVEAVMREIDAVHS